MGTSNIAEDFAAAIEGDLQDIPMFATNLERSRRAVWATVAQSEEERTAIAEAVDNFEYQFTRSGTSFQLERKDKEELFVESLLIEGKDTPYSGGSGGTVTHLDGSETASKVPKNLQGNPLPWYAWGAMPVEEETRAILESTIPEMISSSASNSSAGIRAVEDTLSQSLHLGGGS